MMVTTPTRPKKEKQSKASKPKTTSKELNQLIQNEILRLSQLHCIEPQILKEFAQFVVVKHKEKDPKVPSLTQAQIKEAIYKYFEVSTTPQLKRSGSFRMATDGMTDLNLSSKAGWEKLYREFIGILPNEEFQQGYGCINGIDIFDYFKPWRVFGLDPETAQFQDIKRAYRELSKIYHPDVPETGDAKVFDRINVMYKSISAEA